MFAILQISDRNTIIRPPKIGSQRFNLNSDDAFFIVTVDSHRGKIPWKKLEKCLGILRQDIILPEDITIPEEINITSFTPHILPQIILMNSATDYILQNKVHFTSKTLAIFDESGIYVTYIEKLISCFSSIKIITSKPDKYDHISQKLLEDYGFSLIISSEERYNCDTIISHQCNVPLFFSGTVFTSQKKYLMNATVFSGSDIELPDEYENMRPSNIGRVPFASALYEKCKVKEITTLRYTDFSS